VKISQAKKSFLFYYLTANLLFMFDLAHTHGFISEIFSDNYSIE
tara:strand:+ start:494 stop:625 length:132 start_codon:yes stop_codon:yes gene_type:complete